MKLAVYSLFGLICISISPYVRADAPSTTVACSMRDFSQARSVSFSRATLTAVEFCANGADPVAQNELGRRYGLGNGGVVRDSQKSFDFYQAAANAGYAQAQANLAHMYFNGEGTAKDLEKAYSWALSAAKNGNPQAQYQLGYMHVLGVGVEKDGALAEKWFLAAANQGVVRAQGALAELYSDGKLLPRDPSKAVLWLHRERDARLYDRIWRETSEPRVTIVELRPEYAPKLADRTVKIVQDLAGKQLDYSPESLPVVDALIARFRSEGQTPERLGNTVVFFGCYVGEVFVRNLGFAWVMPDQSKGTRQATLQAPNGKQIDTIEAVRRLLQSANEVDLAEFYAATAKVYAVTDVAPGQAR